MAKKPNIIFLGIDSLRRDHMSSYGYERLTTPHLDKIAKQGVLFENHFSPSIPTTPGYASMLTGKDVFGTDVVALRHEGELLEELRTLPEVLADQGYNTTCVGFSGNPSSRGFQKYLDYEAWMPDETGRCAKAENLNDVTIPEIKRLASQDEPFFLFLRHMDPHSPYLPPKPFERIFYDGDETDPENNSLDKMKAFKPFADFITSWLPEKCTDADYVDAQYDGAVAYMDACIQNIFQTVETLGIEEETIIVITSDHGETLNEHDCWYDHHGLYEHNLVVPLILKYPGKLPEGKRISSTSLISDIMPTLMELIGVDSGINFDGRSLLPLVDGENKDIDEVSDFYITECTWMRKHGWRTPEWKLIKGLEPDIHNKPEIELYNIVKDPEELNNVAEDELEIVRTLIDRMDRFIEKRENETKRKNPIYMNLNWHGLGTGPFKTSQEAYESMYIGSIETAVNLQSKD